MNNYSVEYYALCETERRLHLSLDRSKLPPRHYFFAKPCRDLELAFQQRGWTSSNSEEADFMWVRSRELPANLRPGVLINHLVGVQSLTAKSLLVTSLRKLPQAACFFPRSFTLPSELAVFTRNFRLTQTYCRVASLLEQGITADDDLEVINAGRELLGLPLWSSLETASLKSLFATLRSEVQSSVEGSECVWILKPGRKSRGRGISIHQSLTSIEGALRSGHSYVVQKYIERPLLIEERKFDLRVWAVILGGMEFWIYDHCYARFSVQSYDRADLENCYVHLTNNSVSKWAKDFDKSSIPGCMWSLRQLRAYLRSRFAPGIWTTRLWPQIREIVLQTVLTAVIQPREGAFELLGFDLMITQELDVWLLEVNSSPSLQRSTAVTGHLVPQMLEDLLALVLGESPQRFHRLHVDSAT